MHPTRRRSFINRLGDPSLRAVLKTLFDMIEEDRYQAAWATRHLRRADRLAAERVRLATLDEQRQVLLDVVRKVGRLTRAAARRTTETAPDTGD